MRYQSGRQFLQVPGPTNVPDRILRAMARPTIDHRGPEFSALSAELEERLRGVFQTSGLILIFASSGTGATEAALVNTLSAGDKVLAFETGQFAVMWRDTAARLGLDVDFVAGDWRHGVDPAVVEQRLAGDKHGQIKAVTVVHNETSTGVTSNIGAVRKAMDRAGHDALLMVDTISSLASIDYRPDEWRVDVTVAGSQKGLMLPPGISFNAVSQKALAASKAARLPKSYWNWQLMMQNGRLFFPYTPAINMLFALRESLSMIHEEGLASVFTRHARLAEAARAAVRAWGLDTQCANPDEYSNSVTTVRLPDGHNADEFRKVVLEQFNMALGGGLGKIAGKVFRIGHLGDFNELMLAGTLSGVEMGLALAGVPFKRGGVLAALEHLEKTADVAAAVAR